MKNILFCCLLLCSSLSAQTISGISSKWSDSFVEWELFALASPDKDADPDEKPEEEKIGEFKQRWLNVRDDWSEWDFDVFGIEGTIKAKWKDDPTQWELRSYDGSIITMRTNWGKDLNEWRITDNDVTLNLKCRWTNQKDEWLVDDPRHGKFYIYTLRSLDPRDWAVQDNLEDEVSSAMRIAMTFLVVFQSSPRM